MNRLISIILVLGAIGVFFGYINPTYNGPIKVVQSEISDLDSALATATKFREEQTLLIQERELIDQGDLDRVKKLLPDNVDNVQLILDVDGIATTNGVRISDIGIAESKGGGNAGGNALGQGVLIQDETAYESLVLSFTATATYTQFKNFLTDIEQSLRTLDVVEISFSESETGVYKFDVRVRVYWLK
ncbi:hypothetical protein COB87_001645 [Candidatus Wolfebacteria bacterium]|nr:hypothetical protein [Candidatus Wolfebacteria bacterium]